ncbi:MAG: HAD hydrolase family protein [Acidobacteria bacterium]|nr:HAD hydrolase family protein [Acidobacteriota bacterium]
MENQTILRMKKIRLIVSDVDGVLTDGKLYYAPEMRSHLKAFHVRDGLAVKMAQYAGIRVAFVSAKASPALRRRGAELGVDFCLDGITDKMARVREICDTLQVSREETAAIGDDLVDLPILRYAAFSATVPEAPEDVRNEVDFVTTHSGGKGAFRELVELLIRSRGEWEKVLTHFGGTHEVR